MTWVKLDDGFVRHPRMVAAGLHGRALFIAGLCYCGAHLTDGRIPKAAVPILAAEAGVKSNVAGKLVEIGSWVDRGDEFEVHDFLVYNPPRSKVLADREAGAERQRKARASRGKSRRDEKGSNGVTPRDPSRPDVPTEQSSSAPAAPDAGNPRTRPPSTPDQLADETPARRVAKQHWESRSPRPGVKFIALVKILERFLEAGWKEPQLLVALSSTRAYTVDAIEYTLREANGNGRGVSIVGDGPRSSERVAL